MVLQFYFLRSKFNFTLGFITSCTFLVQPFTLAFAWASTLLADEQAMKV